MNWLNLLHSEEPRVSSSHLVPAAEKHYYDATAIIIHHSDDISQLISNTWVSPDVVPFSSLIRPTMNRRLMKNSFIPFKINL